MRGKGLVKKIIIVFLVAWSIYALYPTYKLNSLSAEKREALDDEGKLVPLVEKAIKMGLDLQGGMYINLEVDLPTMVEQLARNKDERFAGIIARSREEMNISTEPYLDILSSICRQENIPLNRYWGERGDSEGTVIDYLEKEAEDAITRSRLILDNRINQFGVSEPTISKIGNRRILIELPGISDPERARDLIGKTALLEFKMVKDPEVISDVIRRIDTHLAKEMGNIPVEDTLAARDTTKTAPMGASEDKVISVSELFGEEETVRADTAAPDTSLLVDDRIFRENPFIALLRTTRQRAHSVSVPVENIRAVERILEREDVQPFIPVDSEFIWGSETFRIADKSYRDLYLVKREAELTGTYLRDARVTIGQDVESAGRPQVNFSLDRSGARIFSRVTGANIGKNLAIVLDNGVFSAPTIQTKIPNGEGRITGIADMEEARDLAIVLRAGALPAPVQFVEERTVGPSLGRDSINKGSFSALIGLGIVAIFMIIYYRMAGIIANIALILNLILLLAVLAQFGFTLTLPGVAGVVLTIGMAVDANVLIYERIREELKTGKTVRASIDAGYSRVFRTILDANVTTLLTALVLYQFGTGPLRGFAITLSIGILVSMFTALVVTRVIFDAITSRRTLQTLSI